MVDSVFSVEVVISVEVVVRVEVTGLTGIVGTLEVDVIDMMRLVDTLGVDVHVDLDHVALVTLPLQPSARRVTVTHLSWPTRGCEYRFQPLLSPVGHDQ